MLMQPSLKINALSNLATLCVNIIVGFLLTPYIISHLGTANYGIWTLVVTIIGYYGLLDLGVASAVMRYIARYVSRRDYKLANEFVSSSLVIFTGVGFLVLCITLFIPAPLAVFFKITSADFSSFRQVVWLLGITAAMMLPGNVLTVVILAHERFVIANVLRIFSTVLRGVLSFYVLYQGGGLVALGWVSFALAVLHICVAWAVVKIWFGDVLLGFSGIRMAVLKPLFTFGLFSSIIHIGNMLRFKLGAVLLGKFVDMETVGIYGIAALLFGYVTSVIVACSGVTQPRLSAIAGRDMNLFKDAVMRYSNIVAVAAAGLAAVSVTLVFDFVRLWLPKNVTSAEAVGVVFIILAVGLVPELMTDVSKNALQAVNKHYSYAYQTILEGIANLILSVILVRQLGMFGVALGTAIPALVTKLLVQPLYCRRLLGLSFVRYVWFALFSPALVAGAVVWIVAGFGEMVAVESYILIVFKGIVVTCVYLLFAFAFCLEHSNRQMVWSYLKAARIWCFGEAGRGPQTNREIG